MFKPVSPDEWLLIAKATLDTLYMVSLSTVFSICLGLPLGVLLCVTARGGLTPAPLFNQITGRIVNIFRSFPFIILMVAVFPLTKLLVKATIGPRAVIVPLSLAAAPYVARIIESALKEVDPGSIQAARVMGSSNFTIMRKVMIPEAMPALVAGTTLMIINIIGYSAMAGAIGGGGLGFIAISYGHQRFHSGMLVASVVIIIVMVEVIQMIGTRIANNMIKKR